MPPREEHIFSALVVTLFLRQRGWPVVYLGPDVPIERLKPTIDSVNPDLVVYMAMLLDTAASLLDVARFLEAEGVPFAFGGPVFNQIPALIDRVPGYFLGERLEKAAEVIEKILTLNPPIGDGVPAAEAYQVALQHFLAEQPQIEAGIWQMVKDSGMSYRHIAVANSNLSKDIAAALSLGDMHYLQSEIEWIEGFARNYNIPPAALKHYFEAYHQAASQYLDARGEPVLSWLNQVNLDSAD
jgi:hypothetical protein